VEAIDTDPSALLGLARRLGYEGDDASAVARVQEELAHHRTAIRDAHARLFATRDGCHPPGLRVASPPHAEDRSHLARRHARPWDEANVHVLTHTLHYGLGVFEGIRCYEGHDGKSAIFRLAEHVERLFGSAHVLDMAMPFAPRRSRRPASTPSARTG
jgi:hypothetical protein